MRNFSTIAIVTALTLGASAATAGMVQVSGTGHGTSNNEPMPLSEEVVVVRVGSTYEEFTSDNPDNPLLGLSGPCWGSMLIDKGAVSGTGMCRYEATDGGAAVMLWEADGMKDGRTQGTWQVVSGTGSWDSVTGGGRFDAGTDAAGVYTNNVTGELTMP